MLVHTLPAPFLLDAMAGNRGVWHMPRTKPGTIYLTYDDGPNPTTTPDSSGVSRLSIVGPSVSPSARPIGPR